MSVCLAVGTHGNWMGMPLHQADHSREGGAVSRGAGEALPLCDLTVSLLKASKMPLNTPKRGVPKEFRGLTPQRQNRI